MEQNFTINQLNEEEEVFSLKDFLTQCLAKWQWFVCSLLIFLCIGVLYILRQQPQYNRSMAVLIKDQEGGGGAAEISSAFSSMGLVSSNTNVNNELISLTSPAIMYEVIQRLGLNVNYSKGGLFHRVTLYGTTLPVIVKFHDLEEQQGGGFDMDYYPDGRKVLSKFWIMTPDGKVKYDKTINVPADAELVRTPIGKVSILPNPGYAPKVKQTDVLDMRVNCMGMQNTVELYGKRLKGDLADKDAEVIDLSIKDVSPQRAVDILNAIVSVYNENWVEDKNRVAIATSNFIDERLRVIEQELGVVDSDISSYKSQHLIPDLGEAARLYMQESSEKSNEILQSTNQLAMVNYLRDYIKSNPNGVLPVNTGVGSPQLESQIATYNQILLNRNNLVQNSSEANPLVQDYDNQLKGMRESITRAVNAQATTLKAALNNIQGARGVAQSQLASGPTQAKYLLSVERQQKVKESLYLYLLQKREENQLTQTFTAYNTRIITPPTGSLQPVSPKKGLILIVAFLLGLAVPGVALYIAEATNTKVRSRKDLESMAPPFAGEIPFVGHKRPFAKLMQKTASTKKKNKTLEKALAVVKEGNRDSINESFRIVRGNIDFMIGHNEACNVIMMTSFNAGSGKSFISYNLAASFGIKGKKVLVIDGDLRHGSISQYVNMPHKGLSNYLTGNTDDWRSLVVKVADQNNTYILPIGHRPPNPAEMLDNGRLGELLNEARQEYDYVIIDCPPVDVVVDTQIVEKYVDRTIIVVRAGLLEKRALAEIDAIYNNKRFKQVCVILNGTDRSHSRYGRGYHSDYYSTEQ